MFLPTAENLGGEEARGEENRMWQSGLGCAKRLSSSPQDFMWATNAVSLAFQQVSVVFLFSRTLTSTGLTLTLINSCYFLNSFFFFQRKSFLCCLLNVILKNEHLTYRLCTVEFTFI